MKKLLMLSLLLSNTSVFAMQPDEIDTAASSPTISPTAIAKADDVAPDILAPVYATFPDTNGMDDRTKEDIRREVESLEPEEREARIQGILKNAMTLFPMGANLEAQGITLCSALSLSPKDLEASVELFATHLFPLFSNVSATSQAKLIEKALSWNPRVWRETNDFAEKTKILKEKVFPLISENPEEASEAAVNTLGVAFLLFFEGVREVAELEACTLAIQGKADVLLPANINANGKGKILNTALLLSPERLEASAKAIKEFVLPLLSEGLLPEPIRQHPNIHADVIEAALSELHPEELKPRAEVIREDLRTRFPNAVDLPALYGSPFSASNALCMAIRGFFKEDLLKTVDLPKEWRERPDLKRLREEKPSAVVSP